MNKLYLNIVSHYEKCLEKYGDSHLGVDWLDAQEANKRYQIMLEVIKNNDKTVSLLDFGCGTAALYDYIKANRIQNIIYSGLDISNSFIQISKLKYPDTQFYNIDLLDTKSRLPNYDYIIMNGVFTEKRELSFEQMFDYFRRMLIRIFSSCNRAIAFNVRSYHAKNKFDELFHLPFDLLADFITDKLSNDFIIRNDYGLEEYTVYLYKE